MAEENNTDGVKKVSFKLIGIAVGILIVIVIGIVYLRDYMIRSDPKYYLNHYSQGVNFYNKAMFDLAIEEQKLAARARPNSPDPYYGMGLNYMMLKKYDEAVKNFEQAINNGPERIDIKYSYAVALQRMGRMEKALEVYHEMAKQEPNSHQIFSNVGVIQMQLGDSEKSIIALKHAIELKPDYYPSYFNLAKAYEIQGNTNLASKQYLLVIDKASKKKETADIAKAARMRLASLKAKK